MGIARSPGARRWAAKSREPAGQGERGAEGHASALGAACRRRRCLSSVRSTRARAHPAPCPGRKMPRAASPRTHLTQPHRGPLTCRELAAPPRRRGASPSLSPCLAADDDVPARVQLALRRPHSLPRRPGVRACARLLLPPLLLPAAAAAAPSLSGALLGEASAARARSPLTPGGASSARPRRGGSASSSSSRSCPCGSAVARQPSSGPPSWGQLPHGERPPLPRAHTTVESRRRAAAPAQARARV